jgi:pyruvate-formate lyase-activating enzyme
VNQTPAPVFSDLLDHVRMRRYLVVDGQARSMLNPPNWVRLIHAAALAGLGQVQTALELARNALQLPLAPLSLAEALKLMGLVLQREGHPELARGWLEQAAGMAPSDPEINQALERCRPPGYLASEVYAPVQGRTLKRHSPRESEHYIYAIDIVGTCNLRCPTCPVGNMQLGERPRGFMPLAMFAEILRKIAIECPDPDPQIWLFNWGEPLLHPELPDIVRCINEQGYSSYLSSNLNIKHGLDALIAANPTDLKISLSGLSDETYSRTHLRGKIERVIANMRELRKSLDRHQADTHVWVGHHIYRHNQHEIQDMSRLCHELGFDHHPIAAFFQPLEKLVQLAEGTDLKEPVLDLLVEHPRDYINRFRAVRDQRFDCELRFNQTIINYDGSVGLCCSVYSTENQLGARFMEHDHEALQAMKYKHSFCQECYKHGLQYAPQEIHDVAASSNSE